MEIALLCSENAIDNFIQNQDNIKILFASMSPPIVQMFEKAFKRTRFTQSIQNADWRLGY